jgi:uncharacterized protein (DUF433 family)
MDTEICHRKPIIKGTRQTVESIIEYMAGGDTSEDILNEFPELKKRRYFSMFSICCKSKQ